jgi:hypothetical protein
VTSIDANPHDDALNFRVRYLQVKRIRLSFGIDPVDGAETLYGAKSQTL